MINEKLLSREYIHRVGRTARAGGQGHALLFIREEEIGFVRFLKAHKVNVEAMDITWSKVANIQPQVSQMNTSGIHVSLTVSGLAASTFQHCNLFISGAFS